MPSSVASNIPRLYETEDVPLAEKRIRVKYFTPWAGWTWYAAEYCPRRRLCWGLVVGLEVEWGYFALDELEDVRGPGCLRIERDLHFEPTTVEELVQREQIEGAIK